MTTPKVHHYVPESLLRHWGTGKKDFVFVFEKATQREWQAKAAKLARETAFNDFEEGGVTHSLEPLMSHHETRAGPLFKRLRRGDGLRTLTQAERYEISRFVAVQFVRTPTFRSMTRSSMTGLLNLIREERAPSLIAMIAEGAEDSEVRVVAARTLLGYTEQFAKQFAGMDWVLFTPPQGQSFLIGDHPVVLQNQRGAGSPRGNLGFAVPGIEIYLPLAPTLVLAILCLSHRQELQAHEDSPLAQHVLRGLAQGTPCRLLSANVVNLNGLQIQYAERHVFADKPGFALAREMVREHPEVAAGGPRARWE